MSPRPPRLIRGLLARALAADPAAPAILGDLQEDFVVVARARGAAAARWWYRREAVRLILGRAIRGRAILGRTRPGRTILGGSILRHTSVARLSERIVGTSSAGRRAPLGLLTGLAQDAAYALRSLRGSPGFALCTAAVIGLGVGAATSVFGVLEPLVLAPLPFDSPEQLVWIANEAEPGDNSLAAVTSRAANLKDFRERSAAFAALSGYDAFFDQSSYILSGLGEPERLVGAEVVPDLLDVLGVQPLYGRNFTAEEGRPGAPAVVILAHGFWRRRFAADPGVVGRRLDLGGESRTVIGVLPPTFDFSSTFSPGVRVDFLLPFFVHGADDGGYQGNELAIIGRLRPGGTVAAARAELDAILAALVREQPRRWGLGALVTPLQQHLAGPFRSAFLLLAAAAATLLLIVCVNVSNMILARSPSRARELAVRKALGAPRGRLVRQLVVETLLVALAGAVLGSGIAWTVTRFVAVTAASRVPLAAAIGVDGTVLLFAIAAALVTGLLVGLAPALQAAEGGEGAVLRGGGTGGGTSRRAHRVRETLVIVEIAFACVLLVVGGLLVRSFRAVLDVDLGFDASNAVAWQLDPGGRLPSPTAAADYFGAITDRVATVRGVDAVGLIDALPLGRNRTWPYRVVGDPDEARETRDATLAYPHVIDPGYLPAMRVLLIAGRNFTADDGEASRPVVLLNESGARRIFGGEPALGQLLHFWGSWEWEVVGVVRDVRHLSPEMDAGIEAYFPSAQMPDAYTFDMVVRSSLPVPQVAGAVTTAVKDVAPSLPMREFWTVGSTVDRALATRRFTLAVLTAFAFAALLLAGLGIYGVLAHSVAERRLEIGIRMALGASAARVIRSVMKRTLGLAVLGVAAGTLLSLAGARLLNALLFGVSATDPATFVAMAAMVLLVAAAAAWLPARRAARSGTRALNGG